MNSKKYNDLIRREIKLRKSLINKTVIHNPQTSLSQDRLRAYRLLMHAEIEYYFENIVIEKINNEKIKWDNKKIPSQTILSLLAYNECSFPKISSSLSDINSKNDKDFRINKAVGDYIGIIKKNNGIKECNIIPILIPLGIDYSKISQILMNDLSSYGSSRGEVAHNSYKVIKLINPTDEINIVTEIIKGIKDIDDLLLSH
jgi:hypothetical protein